MISQKVLPFSIVTRSPLAILIDDVLSLRKKGYRASFRPTSGNVFCSPDDKELVGMLAELIRSDPSATGVMDSLEGQHLVGLPLEAVTNVSGVSFSRSNLSFADFSASLFTRCAFVECQLKSLLCLETCFNNCTFSKSDLGCVAAVNAKFAHCLFLDCDMQRWTVNGAIFANCTSQNCTKAMWVTDHSTVFYNS